MAHYLILSLLAILLIYSVVVYNALISLKHGVSKAWANIDVLLKQRHDELPKLVEVCRQHMEFERTTLERVMAARAAVQTARESHNVAAVGHAESNLREGLLRIAATAEAYPELRADTSIQQLLARITSLENALSDRRELYNEYVNTNNVRLEQFPDVLIARMFAFKPATLLRISEQERQDVDVRALFRVS